MTQEANAAAMRELLERIWKYNATKAQALDYELIALAIPTFPANIEAVASYDLDVVYGIMEGLIEARKKLVGQLPGAGPTLEQEMRRADDNGHTCGEFSRALRRIRELTTESAIEAIATNVLRMPWLLDEGMPDALPQIEPSAGESPEEPVAAEQAWSGAEAGRADEQVGQGCHRAGEPAEPADAAPEPHDRDAAKNSVGLTTSQLRLTGA